MDCVFNSDDSKLVSSNYVRTEITVNNEIRQKRSEFKETNKQIQSFVSGNFQFCLLT